MSITCEQPQSCSGRLTETRCDGTSGLESESSPRLQFERWLHSLLVDPELVSLEAKNDRDIALYKSVLCRWKVSGYPYPGEWNDSEYHLVSAFTKAWMQLHDKQGFSMPGNAAIQETNQSQKPSETESQTTV